MSVPSDEKNAPEKEEKKEEEEKQGVFLRFVLGLYDMIVDGSIPGMVSAQQLAASYRTGYGSLEDAAYALLRWQNLKCATDGFLTGLPGVMFLPATISFNVASTLAFHIQTVTSIAVLAGYDPHDETVKTLALICLTGEPVKAVLAAWGVTLAQVLAKGLVIAIPRALLGRINYMVGAKLFTKFSNKGIIQLGRMVPLLGGLFGGTVDGFSSYIIGNVAIKTFFHHDQNDAEGQMCKKEDENDDDIKKEDGTSEGTIETEENKTKTE